MSNDYEFTEGGIRFGVFRKIGGGETVVPLEKVDDRFPSPSLSVSDFDVPGVVEAAMASVARVDALILDMAERKAETAAKETPK